MNSVVLVLNCGSSSIKYQLVDADTAAVHASGLVERIGEDAGHLRHLAGAASVDYDDPIADHEAGLAAVLRAFEEAGPTLDDIGLVAVGHRVVHGGDRFSAPVLVDDEVQRTVAELATLAPLHNPPNLTGIEVARRAFPGLPHVAVFDTAFHHTLPPVAYTYAVDRATAREHGVRRYGFHGTSVAYVSRHAARMLGRDPATLKLIVLHLGNGASATAVAGGVSVDTSMGLTPLEGLVMGSRAGDLDSGVIFHLRREAGLGVDDLDELLNRRSGMVGLTGANDLREVHRRAEGGDSDAQLALDVYCYRIRKYVGAYVAALGGVDAIVFTAGVGENDAWVRSHALTGLGAFGIEVDHVRNAAADSGEARAISPDEARVEVLVIPTNEELEIARQTLGVITDG